MVWCVLLVVSKCFSLNYFVVMITFTKMSSWFSYLDVFVLVGYTQCSSHIHAYSSNHEGGNGK